MTPTPLRLAVALTLTLNCSQLLFAADDLLLIEDEEELIIEDEDELLIEDEDEDEELLIEDEDVLLIEDEDTLLIEDENELLIEDDSENELVIEDDSENELEIEDDANEMLLLEEESEDSSLIIDTAADGSAEPASSAPITSTLSPKLDSARLALGHFPDNGANSEQQGYAHAQGSIEWTADPTWEVRLSARVDGYFGQGGENWEETKLDYDESYVRHKSGNHIVTVGTQKVLWGRIDEFPPTDRLSTQDLRRFVIDDLEDRRLASLALRYEHFFTAGKLDLVYYPRFREAEIADPESNWYPVNRRSGTILSLNTTALIEAIVRAVNIDENAPDSDGGFGLRFTSLGSAMDLGVTLQKGRSTAPYFAYNPATNTIEGRFPRSLMVGADVGFEALGGTVKFEANWLSDTPATRGDGRYVEVESIGWGAALELYPGDGDARLNLQITGQTLISAPQVLDRDNIYALNGSFEVPFAEHSWRAKTRFNIGLDENDIYLNPELAYTGWDAQEAYIELHFFEGDKGTIGGFYQDNSMISVGWRGSF